MTEMIFTIREYKLNMETKSINKNKTFNNRKSLKLKIMRSPKITFNNRIKNNSIKIKTSK